MTIEEYLTKLVSYMGLDPEEIKVSQTDNEQSIMVDLQIPEDHTGLFIGYRAEVINSLQRFLRIIFQKELGDKVIRLNINNYQQEKVEKNKERLRRIVDQLQTAEDEYVFPFMSSYERFQIHSLLSSEAEFAGFESFSEGEDEARRLVVRKKTS